MAGLTILRVVDNSTIERDERERTERELQARQNDPFILGLTGYLKTCWDAALIAKRPIERLMLAALRQRNGEYDPAKLVDIRNQGGSEVYMMITEVKCRAAESWLRDILLDQGTPPWDLQPTTLPDLPPDSDEEISQIFAQKVLQLLQYM